jgi:hypothetical protein
MRMREVTVITFVGFVFSALHRLERPRTHLLACRMRRAG